VADEATTADVDEEDAAATGAWVDVVTAAAAEETAEEEPELELEPPGPETLVVMSPLST
jgi:hypothetical protein